MATAQVEERQLLKAMTWWDGFVVALANPGFLIASLGLSIGALAGIRVQLAPHVEANAQSRAGVVAWEPTVTFAGRRVAAWQGALVATTVDLSWRF